MRDYNSTTARWTGGASISIVLESFTAAFFVAALVTDLVYWHAPDATWETFSVWLITAGLMMAGLTCVAGLIGLGRGRPGTRSWTQLLIIAVAYLLGLMNAFIHSRDGYTAVVPTGLLLSILVVVLLGFASWTGPAAVYRSREGVVR